MEVEVGCKGDTCSEGNLVVLDILEVPNDLIPLSEFEVECIGKADYEDPDTKRALQYIEKCKRDRKTTKDRYVVSIALFYIRVRGINTMCVYPLREHGLRRHCPVCQFARFLPGYEGDVLVEGRMASKFAYKANDKDDKIWRQDLNAKYRKIYYFHDTHLDQVKEYPQVDGDGIYFHHNQEYGCFHVHYFPELLFTVNGLGLMSLFELSVIKMVWFLYRMVTGKIRRCNRFNDMYFPIDKVYDKMSRKYVLLYWQYMVYYRKSSIKTDDPVEFVRAMEVEVMMLQDYRAFDFLLRAGLPCVPDSRFENGSLFVQIPEERLRRL